MIHKTAYILAYDMLRRKGGHDWVERRAGGIIGLPYLSLILVALLTLKDDPNNGQKNSYRHIDRMGGCRSMVHLRISVQTF